MSVYCSVSVQNQREETIFLDERTNSYVFVGNCDES